MGNYKTIEFKAIGDERGSLISIEQGQNIPFDIKRVYYIFDTKTDVERGFHAHKKLKQIIIAVKGECRFILDNGQKREEIKLTNPNEGLFIEGLIWREMKDFTEDCVLVVLASEYYSEIDYIRDYTEFLKVADNAKK